MKAPIGQALPLMKRAHPLMIQALTEVKIVTLNSGQMKIWLKILKTKIMKFMRERLALIEVMFLRVLC